MKTKTIQRVYHDTIPGSSIAYFPFVGDIVAYQGNYFYVSEFVPFRKYKAKICNGSYECCDTSYKGLVHFGPFVCSMESLVFIGWAPSDSSDTSRYAFWRLDA